MQRKLTAAGTTLLLLAMSLFAAGNIASIAIMAGCAAKTGGTTTLPSGAVDQTDATVYRVLTDAQVLLNEIRAGVTSGKLTLTPAQKTTFNALITSYNATEALWQSYHAGASKDADGLTASANTLSTNLASAQSTILVNP